MTSNSAPTARLTAVAPFSSRLLALAFAAVSLAGCGQRAPGTSPAAATAGAPAAATADTAGTPLPLIPAAVEVKRGSGSFTVGAGTVISIVPGDADARRSAEHLADLLQRTRGLRLEVRAEASASPGSIRLERSAQAPVAHKEGYSLEADARGVRIAARDGAGLLYGAISAWQLMTPDARKGEVRLPAVTIRDWPRFSWR
ncbi:beta-hexosaminidase, partial [Xanthomonas perforans]